MGSRDYINNLPDEILGKILSLLPTHLAASTLVLSKRWRNLFALVDNLDLNDARGGPLGLRDFVDKTLARLSNTPTFKRFSLTFASDPYDSRVNNWIRTVLEGGCLELHLENVGLDYIETEFFTSKTLVKLTLCVGFFPDRHLPCWTVIFPALKTLSLVRVEFEKVEMYKDFIYGCPVLEDLYILCTDDDCNPTWSGAVSSPSLKRLTILYNYPHYPEAHYWCRFDTPSLVYLDYFSYVADQYEVGLGSLVEARLDVRLWERLRDTTDDDDSDFGVDVFGDATGLVAGIRNVKTLHLSPDSLEVFHFCCKSMPVFHNLLTLSFESDEEKGWQVVPLLLNNAPNLETLIIKGLVHKVTNRCSNACACILKKKKRVEEVCCLSTCQVNVLHISAYHGTYRELKQMSHFLANLKCLETVKIGVKVNHPKDNNEYMRITDDLLKLAKVSSNCQIHFL